MTAVPFEVTERVALVTGSRRAAWGTPWPGGGHAEQESGLVRTSRWKGCLVLAARASSCRATGRHLRIAPARETAVSMTRGRSMTCMTANVTGQQQQWPECRPGPPASGWS